MRRVTARKFVVALLLLALFGAVAIKFMFFSENTSSREFRDHLIIGTVSGERGVWPIDAAERQGGLNPEAAISYWIDVNVAPRIFGVGEHCSWIFQIVSFSGSEHDDPEWALGLAIRWLEGNSIVQPGMLSPQLAGESISVTMKAIDYVIWSLLFILLVWSGCFIVRRWNKEADRATAPLL
jgi:hypothetical protein